MLYNLQTPEGRLDAIEALGVAGYVKSVTDEASKTVVATINGHSIRRIFAGTFGQLYLVGSTGEAMKHYTDAATFALQRPRGVWRDVDQQQLLDELNLWCDLHRVERVGADELLESGDMNAVQRDYLSTWLLRWSVLEA